MSEIRDRVRQRTIEILVKPLRVPYQEDAAEMMVQGAINQAEEILSIPEIAIVDREAELPTAYGEGMSETAKSGYRMAQIEMLKAGFRKIIEDFAK